MSHNKIKYIKINVNLPKDTWIYNLSKKYGDLTFLLKYGHSISDKKRVIFLSVENNKLDLDNVFLFLKKQKDIYNLEIIGDNIKINFKVNFLISLIEDKLTFIYPIIVKEQKAQIELFTNPNHIKLFSKIFKKIAIIKILNYKNYNEEFELSLRQKEVLEVACNLGYFTYPRKISLTELSKYLKISKSTLSEILRSAENKIIHSYFYKK